MSSNEWSYNGGSVNGFRFRNNSQLVCNCGWEVKFGYGVAVTLAIFEAKRFFMLVLEMFAEWHVIKFAGGLQPVILTFLDISIGLPTALIAIRLIRKRRAPRCRSKTKRFLKYLLLVILTCVSLNVATLASIGYHISVRRDTLIDVFNASMRLYVSATSYKYAIDEIQFVFQCCGHSSYADWFHFDWQRVDYASRDEMAAQDRLSDEDYRHRGVPFSCCSLRAMTPCMHTEMMERDIRTVNTIGCADIIGPVLVRIVVVAYVMTSTLVVTQALLAFLIARVIDKLLPNCGSELGHKPLIIKGCGGKGRSSGSSTSDSEYTSSRTRNTRKTCSRKCLSPTKRTRDRRRENFRGGGPITTSSTEVSPRVDPSAPDSQSTRGAAKIKPTVHEEHRVSKKLSFAKKCSNH